MNEPLISAVVAADELRDHYDDVVRRMTKAINSGAEDDLTVFIGEANSVFSGIWGQLDQARAAAAAAGHDVSGYDSIRAAQGVTTEFGVLDSTHNSSLQVGALALGVLATTTELGARFNVEGAAAAGRASDLFKTMLPGVDWASERAQRDQPHLELRGGFKAMRGVAIAVGVAVVLGFIYLLAS